MLQYMLILCNQQELSLKIENTQLINFCRREKQKSYTWVKNKNIKKKILMIEILF